MRQVWNAVDIYSVFIAKSGIVEVFREALWTFTLDRAEACFKKAKEGDKKWGQLN
jgi:hypothetical protein